MRLNRDMNDSVKVLSRTVVAYSVVERARLGLGMSLAAIALLLASCKKPEPEAPSESVVPDPVAMKVGEREVRLSELQAEIDYLHQKRNPSALDRDAFLEPCIERLVALEKARELGLDQDMELRRQWENLLIGRLRQTELDAKVRELTVAEEDIRTYYERNIEAYSSPAQIRLALLFLSVPVRSDEAAREAVRRRMEEARESALELPSGSRGFGAQAMTYSEEATSRFKGGDIGWLKAGASSYRWPEAVVEAGFALRDNGTVSEVIAAEEGYYLLKKLDSREAVVRSLDGRMRASLENALLKEKRADMEAQLKSGWKAAAPITLHEEILSELTFPSVSGRPGAAKPFPTAP